MIPKRLSRRDFLEAALLHATALAVLPSLVACGPEVPDDQLKDKGNDKDPTPPKGQSSADHQQVLQTFFAGGLLSESRNLGRFYIEKENLGNDREGANELLKPTFDLIEKSSTDANALMSLKTTITDDFAEQNTIVLGGWTFSLTEVQLCALSYLYA